MEVRVMEGGQKWKRKCERAGRPLEIRRKNEKESVSL